jgi:hypothetical protein
MPLNRDDLLAITRPAGPEAGSYQLPVAALAEQLCTVPVLGSSGILWSTVRSAADNSWEWVCWSPELQLYVAVAGTGSGNRVMTRQWLIRTGWRSAGRPSWGCSWP